jgi:transposase
MVLDGPMKLEALRAYVEQVPMPTLRPGERPAHRSSEFRDGIEAVDASLRYLPPYSPELNPIENAFAQLKALIREAAVRSIDTRRHVIGDAPPTVSPVECANYFIAAGYEPE